MQEFTDSKGRVWPIRFTAPKLEAIRKRHGVQLTSWDAPPFERLAADPELLVNVLWDSVTREAHPDVEAESFAEALDGDVLGLASEALMEAVTDFFPPSKRSLRRSLLAKAAAIDAEAADLALAKLDEPATRQAIRKAIETRLEAGSIVSAASPATPLATSASESAGSSPAVTRLRRAFG